MSTRSAPGDSVHGSLGHRCESMGYGGLMRDRTVRLWKGILAASLVASGCSAESYSRRAERSAELLLAKRDEAVLGDREATTAYPLSQAPESAEEPAEPGESEPSPHVLDLKTALAIAYASNREMIARREVLQLQALSLSSTRHDFAPQLALTLAYLFDDPSHAPYQGTSGANFSASQILPTGGFLVLDAATSSSNPEDASADYGSLVSLALVQPLLRGGGHAVAHEPLIQAERDLVYAIREFELFRELTFLEPDPVRFPTLELGYRCVEEGSDAGSVLNASDEVAVEAFLKSRIAFADIWRINSAVLDQRPGLDQSFEALLEADGFARARAREAVRMVESG